MTITKRSLLAAAAGLAALPRAARAQGQPPGERFPSRPIRVIVPYAPGGATDIVARLLGEEMRRQLGQPLVVENRPGAAGIIAIEAMARSRPDGHTVMIGNVTTNAITPVLFRQRMPLDYAKEVVAVGRLADLPAFVLATATNFAPRTLEEFVAYARANPGKVNYCSAGVGSYPQFDAVLFARRAGIEMVHVPMPGGAGPIITEMLSGNIQFCMLNVATAAGHVRDGRIRALAAISDARLPEFPDIPTLAEAGYPGIGTIAWQGMFAPAATPREALEALHRAATEALRAEPVLDAFRRQGIRAVPNASVDDARAWFEGELANWRRIVEEAKIEVNN
ncbi:Bug family tripartite tricarboxylate transporter substrate binding protein [Caldovatus aquaticus]|uniref:Tripartite tricarboxylate transporter substrate binding protein n=1 Tax=Caldovatus aquaticus TaxID=2865671 RepID=A0ABS7EX86_9PROT|nr:tripartite tricarboxylate transporter substrate binding protein [Caldovatus aquaticus]MBW8267972.1 tripartite tricarboxylate transporter substrate binding protein [Caldovatus aquaticus]